MCVCVCVCVCVLGDLYRWVGDRVRAGITGAFRVRGKNNNGWKVVGFCGEKGFYANGVYFKHKNLYKYIRVV